MPTEVSPDATPAVRSGYAYEWDGEDWDTVVYAPTGLETFSYRIRIDGVLCNVFTTPTGGKIAQLRTDR